MPRLARALGLCCAPLCWAALACAPKPEAVVVGTRELPPTAQVPAIRGRDGGYSARAFGRSIWLFGDTTLTLPDSRGSSWRHNSWSHTLDVVAEDGITGFESPVDEWGGPAELFPYTAEEWAYNEAHAPHNPDCEDPCGARVMLWPMAMINDGENDRSLVFYGKFGGEPGEWNFWPLGSSVAVWTDFDYGPVRPVLDAGSDEPTLLFHSPEPQFGAAAVIHDGMLWAFACGNEEPKLDKPCRLARVELDAIFQRDQWRFWDGEGFGDSLAAAAPVFDGHTMLSVHFNHHVGRWLAIYSEPLSERVVLRTAPALEGPWSAPELIFEAEPGHDGAAPYAALAHREFRRQSGRFEYVSYYRSTDDWAGEIRLVEVELAAIGGGS